MIEQQGENAESRHDQIEMSSQIDDDENGNEEEQPLWMATKEGIHSISVLT